MPNEAYAVVSQTPSTMITPGGEIVPCMEVTFRTKPSSVTGKVCVPISAYGPDEVDRLVRAQTALVEAVQAL